MNHTKYNQLCEKNTGIEPASTMLMLAYRLYEILEAKILDAEDGDAGSYNYREQLPGHFDDVFDTVFRSKSDMEINGTLHFLCQVWQHGKILKERWDYKELQKARKR